MSVLETLQEANKLRNKLWDKEGQLTGLFFSTELAGEVGEACNLVKKIEREKLGLRGSRATLSDLAAELADIVIVCSILANYYSIDLPPEVRKKFNQTSIKLGFPVVIS